jgi:predicted permease
MNWWQRLMHGRRVERQLDAELRFHLERLIADNLATGMSADEARREACLAFGGLDQAKEACRDVRGTRWVAFIAQDIRLTCRMLRKEPGFAAAAICTLALGIGANTAIFSVVYSVLLRPLPYDAPDELVTVSSYIAQTRARFPSLPVRAVDFAEIRRSNTVFAGLSALAGIDFTLTGTGEPERLSGARVSSNFFSLVGVQPEHGRTFAPEEDDPGRDRVVVISHDLWVRRFGASPMILNGTVSLNGTTHTVIGVMPALFLFPTGKQLHPLIPFGPRVDVWKPLALSRDEVASEGSWNYGVIARLKPGTGMKAAQHEMDGIMRSITERVRKQAHLDNIDIRGEMRPIRQVFSGNIRRELLLLSGAVGLLLLIACVNVANLLLARTSGRGREFATRIALGASRSRLARQLLTESLVIAFAGGAAGVLLAMWGTHLLASLGPADSPALHASHVNAPVLLFTIVAVLLTGVAFGVMPALDSGRGDVHRDLKDGSRGVTSGVRGIRLRRVLVAVEVALCTALLMVAGLLLHSFVNVVRVDKGFVAERVLSIDLSLPGQSYARARAAQFYDDLVERVRGLPGVAAAGASTVLPLISEANTNGIRLESDRDYSHDLERPVAVARNVTSGYFATLGIPLVAGRFFEEHEPGPVAVISAGLARDLWPNEPPASAIGRRIRQGDLDAPLLTIVGVAVEVQSGAMDRKPMPAIYRPHAQMVSRTMTLVARTSQPPESSAAAIRAVIRQMDKELPIPPAKRLDEIVSASVATRRFQAALIVLFAALSLALAVVGVSGVMTYAVARQTHEIGVRVALGAQRSTVLRTVLLQGLRPVVAGLAVGSLAAAMAARSLQSFLFGIEPLDPIALGTAGGLLLLAASLACYLPARRAANMDPLIALRFE